MLKACLDTNVWLSGLGFPGTPAEIVTLAFNRKFQVVTSLFILDELEKNLVHKLDVKPRTAKRLLVACKAISEIGNTLTLNESDVMFGINGSDEHANIDYIQELISFAKDEVPHWYSKRDESFFSSSIVSVSRKHYLQALPKIREFFENLQTELEVSAGADELIYFNLQVFPQSKCKKK